VSPVQSTVVRLSSTMPGGGQIIGWIKKVVLVAHGSGSANIRW